MDANGRLPGSRDWIDSTLLQLEVISNLVAMGWLCPYLAEIRNRRNIRWLEENLSLFKDVLQELDDTKVDWEDLQVLQAQGSVIILHDKARPVGVPIPLWVYMRKCWLVGFLAPLELVFISLFGFLISRAALTFGTGPFSIYLLAGLFSGGLLFSLDKYLRGMIDEVRGVRVIFQLIQERDAGRGNR